MSTHPNIQTSSWMCKSPKANQAATNVTPAFSVWTTKYLHRSDRAERSVPRRPIRISRGCTIMAAHIVIGARMPPIFFIIVTMSVSRPRPTKPTMFHLRPGQGEP